MVTVGLGHHCYKRIKSLDSQNKGPVWNATVWLMRSWWQRGHWL